MRKSTAATSRGRTAAEEVGAKTSAGLAEVGEAEEAEEAEVLEAPAQEGAPRRAPVAIAAETGTDPLASGLTAAMVVATLVLCIGGLAAAAMVRGVNPSLVSLIYGKMVFFAGGSFLLAIIAAVVTFFLAKRSS